MSDQNEPPPSSWATQFMPQRPSLELISRERTPHTYLLLKAQAGKEFLHAHELVLKDLTQGRLGVDEIARAIKYDRFMYLGLLSLADQATRELARTTSVEDMLAPKKVQEEKAALRSTLQQLIEDVHINRQPISDQALGHVLTDIDKRLDFARQTEASIGQYIAAIQNPESKDSRSFVERVSRDSMAQFQDQYDQNLLPLQRDLEFLANNVRTLQSSYPHVSEATKEIWSLALTFADHAVSQMTDLHSVPEHMRQGWQR